MGKISTLCEFTNYIKLMLGYSVNNVELSNEQLQQVAYDCIDIFNRYNYDDGNYRDYAVFTTSSGVDEYSLAGQNILDTIDLQLSFGVDGINTLFTPQHTLLYNDWVVKGQYPGAGNSGGGLMLTDYQIGMTYLQEISNMFGRKYNVDWRPNREVLKITPTPNSVMTGVLIIYRKETAEKLYNNILVKELAVARSMVLWGRILGKKNIPLPGGGTINGVEIKNEGYTLEKEIMERVKGEGSPIDFFIG